MVRVDIVLDVAVVAKGLYIQEFPIGDSTCHPRGIESDVNDGAGLECRIVTLVTDEEAKCMNHIR